MIHDIAVETCAMRLCQGKLLVAVMAAQMKAIHQSAFEMFHGQGRYVATRSTKVRCKKLNVEHVREGAMPLLDIGAMEIDMVPIKYALDFVFYSEGGRHAPASMNLVRQSLMVHKKLKVWPLAIKIHPLCNLVWS